MWGETERKAKRREEASRVQLLLVDFLPEGQLTGMLACKVMGVIVSTNQSWFTGHLLHFLLVSFSPLFPIFPFSVLEALLALFLLFFLCTSISVCLSLCLFCPPTPTPYTHPSRSPRKMLFSVIYPHLSGTQHQPWPRENSLRTQSIPTTHTDLSNRDFTSNSIGFADIRWANYSL